MAEMVIVQSSRSTWLVEHRHRAPDAVTRAAVGVTSTLKLTAQSAHSSARCGAAPAAPGAASIR